MNCAVRPTGAVAVLDGLAPTDHVCWSVLPDDDYELLAKTCLAEGSQAGDKVFYFGPQDALGTASTVDGAAAYDPRIAFLGGGPLNPDAMLSMFRREAAVAHEEGFRALRVVADMDWVSGLSTNAELTAFELRLDAAVNDIGAIVVCAYRHGTYTPADVAAVNTVHPLQFGTVADELGFRVWNSGTSDWHIDGEVDCFNAEPFALALAAAAADGPVRICLERLAFIDVAGMRAIARTARSDAAVRIRFEAASDTFLRCWTLLGYDALAPSVELAA